MRGARPWLGSSNSTSPGEPSSAREIATICISPPDRFSHSRCMRYSSALKISKHSFSRPGAEARALLARSTRLRSTVSVGKMRRSSGTQPMPRRAISCVGHARDVVAVEEDASHPAPRTGRGSSAASWSCPRRWARAAPPPRRRRPRARRRRAPASRRSTSGRRAAQDHACAQVRALHPGIGAQLGRACPARSPVPSASRRCGRRGRTGTACRARSARW